MKVLFIAGREPSYVRNVMLLKALELLGHETIECTDPARTYLARFPRVLAKFLRRRAHRVETVVVGFFGQPLVHVIKGLVRRPLLFDACYAWEKQLAAKAPTRCTVPSTRASRYCSMLISPARAPERHRCLPPRSPR